MAAVRAIQMAGVRLASEEPAEVDLWVLVPTLGLVGLGVAMGYSASIPTAAAHSGSVVSHLLRECAYVAVGLVGMVLAARASMERLRKRASLLLALAAGLLVLVFFVPARNGAHSWIWIPGTPISFQPSELAKLVLVIVAARYFVHFPQGLPDRRAAFPPFAVMLAVAGLIAVEPDMGTAAVTATAMMVYFHIAGAKLRHLCAVGSIAAIPAAAMVLKHPYQLQRLLDFFRGKEVELAGGYQTMRSLIALGSGGLTGCGYCGSIEKYFYLPAATTDSILAVVGEELGMVMTWAVLAMVGVLVWRAMQIAGRAPDRFSGLVVAGVACLIGVQSLLNIAVVTGSLPPTGVPLPFVSYGGSSLLFSMIGVGLILNVSRRSRALPQGQEPA